MWERHDDKWPPACHTGRVTAGDGEWGRAPEQEAHGEGVATSPLPPTLTLGKLGWNVA